MSMMRKQFIKTTEDCLQADPNLVVLLGDIGVFGFRNAFKNFPARVTNIGILEQSTIGVAAGLAKTGLTPIVHTIAPFLVERAFEQLKDDFCYQRLGGNFVTVGASYDYAALGCTHHCPGDIAVLKALPRMEIITPGTAGEFDFLFRQTYANGNPTYFRLSERENRETRDVEFGKAKVIQKGNEATIVAVGTMLQPVLDALRGADVTILYYSTVAPFDSAALRENAISSRIILCEPYYVGGLATDISMAMERRPHTLDFIGVPKQFITSYGKAEEHDLALGLTPPDILKRVEFIVDRPVSKREPFQEFKHPC
jgi:transketolase